MEAAMRPTLHALSSNIINTNNKCHKIRRNHIHFLSSCSPTFRRNFDFPGKSLKFNRFTASSSTSNPLHQNPSQELAVLLEVEGVLMDVYRFGNRQAFNVAFRKLGLDCANWSEPVYLDLVRKSAGDEERMLILYFNRIGWPTSLPTSEKGAFAKSVLREKKNALDDFVVSKSLPLRPGVEDFIDDACKEGIPVVILIAYSKSGNKMARSIIEKLGDDRTSKIRIIGTEEVKKSLYGQLVLGEGVTSSLDEQLAKEANKAVSTEKLRVAEEVASMLKLRVEIDTSSTEDIEKIVAALRAGSEIAEVPVYNCVLIAGSQSGVAGAERIGMPCVVVRSRWFSHGRGRAEMGTAWCGVREQRRGKLEYSSKRDDPEASRESYNSERGERKSFTRFREKAAKLAPQIHAIQKKLLQISRSDTMSNFMFT